MSLPQPWEHLWIPEGHAVSGFDPFARAASSAGDGLPLSFPLNLSSSVTSQEASSDSTQRSQSLASVFLWHRVSGKASFHPLCLSLGFTYLFPLTDPRQLAL